MKRMTALFLLTMLLLWGAAGFAEQTLALPAALKAIEDEAFLGLQSVDSVVLPEGIERIGSQAFADSTISSINLPRSLTRIEEDAFENCDLLTATVPWSSYAQDWCEENGVAYSLIEADESDFAYDIVGGEARITAYTGEDSIVVVPDTLDGYSVTMIGEEAFAFNYVLEEVFLPHSLKTIEFNAFMGCMNLTSVILPMGLEFIDYDAFAYCGLYNVYIPPRVWNLDNTSFRDCENLEEIDVDPNNEIYASEDGVLFSKDMTQLLAYPMGKDDVYYTVPDGVTAIDGNAFMTSGVEVVELPESLRVIRDYAFFWCEELRTVMMPDSVTEIGEYAFVCCDKVQINVPAGSDAFDRAAELGLVVLWAEADAQEADTGDTVTFTAYAANCAEPCKFYFELYRDQALVYTRAYTTDASFSFVAEEAGEYDVLVKIKDNDGVIRGIQSGMVMVYAPLMIGSVDSSAEAALGETIVWTVNAQGGAAPLTYAFDVFVNGEEIDGTTFGESNTFAYTPDIAGSYSVNARVRDAKGNTVELLSGDTMVFSPESDFAYTVSEGSATVTAYNGAASAVIIPPELGGYAVTAIGDNAFKNNKTLTRVEIPEGVTSVGNYAFCGCTALTQAALPETLTAIGNYGFQGCKLLSVINFPEEIASIGEYAFDSCMSIPAIDFPPKLTKISYRAFYECSSLTELTIPEGVMLIEGDAFRRCSGVTKLCLPQSLKTLGTYCFSYCEGLTEVVIPQGVTEIKDGAFEYCTALETINIPFGVTTLYGTFRGCSSLPSVQLPQELTSIGGYTFADCIALTDVTIPQSVTAIGYSAFAGCTALEKDLQIPVTVTSVGSGAFSDCPARLYCTIGSSGAQALGSVGFSFVDTTYPDFAFCQTSATKMTLTKYLGSDTEVTVAGGYGSLGYDVVNVGAIAEHAFANNKTIKKVTISNGPTELGRYAFSGCTALTDVTIPGSVLSLEGYTFDGCSSLFMINLGSGMKYIADYAFYNCCGNITFPTSISSIGSKSRVFWNANVNVFVYEGSYAHTWCVQNNMPYDFPYY